MKFRKRITIIPGVRLNLSGSGVSITGGIPGLSVNVGKRGAYLNTGIPGTGLYERTRLRSSRRTLGPAGGSSPATGGSPGSTGRGGAGLSAAPAGSTPPVPLPFGSIRRLRRISSNAGRYVSARGERRRVDQVEIVPVSEAQRL
jgi:hypothetical protein